VSDEKSKDVQIHGSVRKDLAGSLLDEVRPVDPGLPAGSLLDGPPPDDEAMRSVGEFLTVRQVAKVLGMCPATVHRLCERGELAHDRVHHAIRVDPMEVKAVLQRSRAKRHP
jgi:hypothetical protein